jgi:xanthine dehydrogenase accessory factor
VDRLKQAGLNATDLARIHAPIGLDIDAISPAEIAVAIMGEITKVLRQKADAA